MYFSKSFIPILKENPSEAKIKSHQLMLRTGMIKQSSAGIYSWLPLGFTVMKKIDPLKSSDAANWGSTRVILRICIEKWLKKQLFRKRIYKYFFSKCFKWVHFQFGGSFYEYLQLQGAFFENFDFSAIHGWSKVKISRKIEKIMKF